MSKELPPFENYVAGIPAHNRYMLDRELDFDHNDFDVDLGAIAGPMLDWELLAPALSLTDVDISDILSNNSRQPELQRREALQKWKGRCGFQATYGALLRIFVANNHLKNSHKCALKIREVLGATGPVTAVGSVHVDTTPQGPPGNYPPQGAGDHGGQPQGGYGGPPGNYPPQGAGGHGGQPQGGYGGPPGNYPPQGGYGGPPGNYPPQGAGGHGGQHQGGYGGQPGNYPPQGGHGGQGGYNGQPPVGGQPANFPPQQSNGTHPPSGPPGAQAPGYDSAPRQPPGPQVPQTQAPPAGAGAVKIGHSVDITPLVDSEPLSLELIQFDIGVASSNEYKQNTVECDGVDKIVQYEAYDRATHWAQLKLHDDKRITEIRPQQFIQTPEPQGYYQMNSSRHGVALIINNRSFKDSYRHKERVGTERDEENLIQTFFFLGYRPVVCNNYTSAEIRNIFTYLDAFLTSSNNTAKVKVSNDSFVCCILSHGNKDAIIGSDSEGVPREDIEKLTGESKILNSKPKIFFLQACQGSDFGTVPSQRVESDASGSKRADFYICSATVYGDKSYRDKFTGSWFITEVCKILCELGTRYSLNNQFQLHLNQNVSNNPDYQYEADDGNFYVQQPSCSNQLQHHVHFFSSQ